MHLCLVCSSSFSQTKGGIENYNYLRKGEEYVWMPVVHFQTRSKIYTEIRYNYEEKQTLSLFGGRTFSGGRNLLFSFTPMAGLSSGRFSGVSLATRAEAEWNNIYASMETQYSMATNKNRTNFFFNWSELEYYVMKNLFAGLTVQYTRQQGINELQPGFAAGLEFKNMSIPVYIFNPFRNSSYLVVGLNYEYNLKKKK